VTAAKGYKQGYELLAYYDATTIGRRRFLYPLTQQNDILIHIAEGTSTLAHGKESFGSKEEMNVLTC
jgi:hypothetical protein